MTTPLQTVTRYALTHVNRDGVRQLSRPNQGGLMFDDRRDAETFMIATQQNNSLASLAGVFGAQALNTFAVRPVECYLNGDAVCIYFPDAPADTAAPDLLATVQKFEADALNLHCVLQSTAHMDPNDRRIAVITGQVVRSLQTMRDEARAAIAKATAN